MRSHRSMCRMKKLGLLGVMGATLHLGLGSCDLGEFTTTTTTTLNGRDVVTFLVRSAILTPIEKFIDDRIADFFGNNDDEA